MTTARFDDVVAATGSTADIRNIISVSLALKNYDVTTFPYMNSLVPRPTSQLRMDYITATRVAVM